MKRIHTIEVLLERAERLSKARLNRFGTTVYYVTFEDGIYELYHYGTLTIRYDYKNKELLHYYGESVSDRDSMNTFLSYLGEHRYTFRYGSRMGFIMEVNHEDGTLETFDTRGKEVTYP